MPKKNIVLKESLNVICEVAPNLTEGEIIKIEPHNPPRVDDVGLKKARKPLSQESLDKLSKAREMAYKKRMELKAEREIIKIEPKKEPNEESEEENDKIITTVSDPKKKKKKKKKPIVVVEQSSTDSEEEQQVIYIKKKEKKITSESDNKKVIIKEEAPVITTEPQLQYITPNTQHPRYGYNPSYMAPQNKFSNRRHF